MRRLSTVSDAITQVPGSMISAACRRDSYSSASFSPSSRHHYSGAGNSNNGPPSCALNRHVPSRNRTNSQQEIEDSALQFLERRKSTDSCVVGQIQPNLYRRRGSVISVVSSASSIKGNESGTGTTISEGVITLANSIEETENSSFSVIGRVKIQFSYNFSKSDFIVQILEASITFPHLKCSSFSTQISECHFCVFLRSNSEANNELKRRGDLRKIENDKVEDDSDEIFKFAMAYDQILQQNLVLELVSQRKNYSQKSIIKLAQTSPIALSSLNPSSDELIIWLDLKAFNHMENTFGELFLCIQYLPSAARLSLTIYKADHLPARDEGLPNTFVRASLIGPPSDTSTSTTNKETILKKRKTSVRKSSISPVWNEVLTFTIDQNLITKCRLEVLVVDCDRFGNHRPIGRINFGTMPNIIKTPGVTASPSRLWRDAIHNRYGTPMLPQWWPLEKFVTVSQTTTSQSTN